MRTYPYRRLRTTQPTRPTPPNYDNPICDHLDLLVDCRNMYEAVNGVLVTDTGVGSADGKLIREGFKDGFCTSAPNVSVYGIRGPTSRITTGNSTQMVFIPYIRNLATAYEYVCGNYNGSGSGITISHSLASPSGGWAAFDGPGLISAGETLSNRDRVVLTHTRNTALANPHRLYRDGILKAQGSGSLSSWGISPFCVNTLQTGSIGWSSRSAVTHAIRWARALLDEEIADLYQNWWQVFEPDVKLWFLPIGAAGTTISCTPGNAVAAGTAAQINSALSLGTNTGNAVADGIASTINAATSVSTVTGNAVADGIAATINAATSISTVTGNAVAAGTTATVEISSGISVFCTPGDAAAAGTTATINEAYSLNCAVGNCVAAGTQALIDLVFGTVARPSADVPGGAWQASTGTDKYAMIDEAVLDTGDYIYSTAAAQVQRVKLSAVSPGASPALTYVVSSSTSSGIIVTLQQGTTDIASETRTGLPATPTSYTLTLTAPQIAAISDWTDLYLKLESV